MQRREKVSPCQGEALRPQRLQTALGRGGHRAWKSPGRSREELAELAPPCYLIDMDEKLTKESRMLAQERRQHIFEAIETSGVASVRELAQRFDVSSITVVRDL